MNARRALWTGIIALYTALFPVLGWSNPLVLFDDGHAQTAGNADWVIKGGFSDFADTFIDQGCDVRAISKINTEDLKKASILVLPEPNSVYSSEEERLIVDFVLNGGHLYVIADHDKSDRNGDGIDSVGVFNRFLPKLGLEIEKRYFTEAPNAGKILDTPFTKNVKAVGTWGGTSVRLLSSTAQAHITVSSRNGGGAWMASNIVGKGGKVIAMGDSSPYDDGTGNPRDKLHNGFTNPQYDHDILAANTVKWLLEKNGATPSYSLETLARELSAVHNRMKTTPSDNLLQYAESCEQQISTYLKADPKSIPGFLRQNQNREAFQGLCADLETRQKFQTMHGN